MEQRRSFNFKMPRKLKTPFLKTNYFLFCENRQNRYKLLDASFEIYYRNHGS